MTWEKLSSPAFWLGHAKDRLSEPLLINIASLFAAVFGGLRTKIELDLIDRRPYAFGVLYAADAAKELGIDRIAAIEFGVASGVGLRSLAKIATAVAKKTGVQIDCFGFDTGTGMPPPVDHRDHPELYYTGDYPMDVRALTAALPSNTRLLIGDARETIPPFMGSYDGVVGFVAIDVDYYSSAISCFSIFEGAGAKYLPVVPVFCDDTILDSHNEWCGERLAIREFSDGNPLRKLAPFTALRTKRICKNASWISQMYALHVLDHPARSVEGNRRTEAHLM